MRQLEGIADVLSEPGASVLAEQAAAIKGIFAEQVEYDLETELNDFQVAMNTLGFIAGHLKTEPRKTMETALDAIAGAMDCEMARFDGLTGKRFVFGD